VGSVGFVAKNFEELVADTFMLLMCLATFTNVIARYIFNESFQWAEEFSRYSFIWVVFIGAALCTKHKRHIVIDGFVLALPKRLTHLISSFVDLVSIGFMLVLIYYGWVLCTFATQPTSTLKIPQYLVYAVVPLSAILITIYSVRDLRHDLRAYIAGGEA